MIGSWLGLFAILMATLAPTVSHTLAAWRSASGMQDEHCAMVSMAPMDGMASMPDMPDMPDMPGMHHGSRMHDMAGKPASNAIVKAASNQATDTHTHTAASDGDACGYCSLLAHMPAVPSVEALFFVTVRAIQLRVAVRFERVRRVEPLTSAQPRAPPLHS